MRVIVFFDLPTTTSTARKEYAKFRKFLIQSGFMMLQESVYCKMAPNATAGDSISYNVKRHRPPEGLVQVLKVTEKQYAHMEFIVGDKKNDVLDTDDRIVYL